MKAIVIYYAGQAPTDSQILAIRDFVAKNMHYVNTSSADTQVAITAIDDESVAKMLVNNTAPELLEQEATVEYKCVREVNKSIEELAKECNNNPFLIAAKLVERSNNDTLLRRRITKVIHSNLEISNPNVLTVVKKILSYE